jgi:hypothetical protein
MDRSSSGEPAREGEKEGEKEVYGVYNVLFGLRATEE